MRYPTTIQLADIERLTTRDGFSEPFHKVTFNLVSEGIPREEWKLKKTRKYDIFIEAQIWNEQAILNYLQEKI